MTDDTELVRSLYRAYQQQDRDALERLIAPGFTFSSPLDDRIDRVADGQVTSAEVYFGWDVATV
jgi:ketosteroid isomerase-like protein